MNTVTRLAAPALVSLLALGALGACASETVVDVAKVKTEVTSLIAESNGEKPASVDCPDEDPKAVANASFVCTYTMASGVEGTVKVTQDDDRGNVSLKLAVTGADLENNIADDFNVQSKDDQAKKVECPQVIDTSADASQECSITTDGGAGYVATVTVDKAGDLEWSYAEAE